MAGSIDALLAPCLAALAGAVEGIATAIEARPDHLAPSPPRPLAPTHTTPLTLP